LAVEVTCTWLAGATIVLFLIYVAMRTYLRITRRRHWERIERERYQPTQEEIRNGWRSPEGDGGDWGGTGNPWP